MPTPLFVTGRKHRPVLNSIGRALIGAILFNALSPLSVLAQDKPPTHPLIQNQLQQLSMFKRRAELPAVEYTRSDAERLSDGFREARALARDLAGHGRPQVARKGSADGPKEVRAVGPDMFVAVERGEADVLGDALRVAKANRLTEQLTVLQRARGGMRAELNATRRDLQARHVTAEILARHDAVVQEFEKRASAFDSAARAWIDSKGQAAALAELVDVLDRQIGRPDATPPDSRKLPWRTPSSTIRPPAENKVAWFQNLWSHNSVKLADASSVGPINFNIPPEASQAPTEADLAPTPEAAITPEIQSKAVELGRNPLQIHNWVRNQIEWLPTWGAVQSSGETLAKKRGNAHDIASLEIALLRASGVPARYQYGTVEIDAQKMQNWVGGVPRPEVVQQILAQGGIANRGLVRGGQIVAIRMEHVWVQAFVNWLPSRGAKQGQGTQHVNPIGTLNAWVPLDSSFKQYQLVARENISASVPYDIAAAYSSAAGAAVVDHSGYAIRGFDPNKLQSSVEDFSNRLGTYYKTNRADLTAADVVGKKIIPVNLPEFLAGSLPYAVIQGGDRVAAIPPALVHQVTVNMFDSAYARADGSPTSSFTAPLHQFSTGLGVHYKAATPADQALIDQAPATGSGVLPAYLIKMVGEMKLNGRVVATLPVATMGRDQFWSATFHDPSGLHSESMDFKLDGAVGDEIVFGVDASGISGGSITDRHRAVKNDSANETLTLLAMNYWSLSDSMRDILAAHVGMKTLRLPSIGMFAQPLQVQYSWGIPVRAHYAGRMMDVRRSLIAVVADEGTRTADFVRAQGNVDSYLEGATLDVLFGHGLGASTSAVSAINDAVTQGRQVLLVTAANYQELRPLLNNLPYTDIATIDDAVSNGREVLVPTEAIQRGSWSGVGMVITDPATGAGAYLISGGSNGGDEEVCDKEKEKQPQTSPVPDLGFLGKLFFALIMIALAAAVIACIIGTIGVCGGAAAPVVATVGAVLFAQSAAAQSLNFIPVRPLDGFGYYAWSSTFGKAYGSWFTSAPDVVLPTCDEGTRKSLQAAKEVMCAMPRSCKGKQPCPDYQIKIQNGVNCAAARIAVMSTCYPTGPGTFGDAAHINELGSVMEVLGYCMCMAGVGACPIQLP